MGSIETAAPFLMALLFVSASAADVIHVSPAGDDSAAGTRAAPVRTLERARDLARSAAKPAKVVLLPGIHRLERTLALGVADSDVEWSAEGGAVVSGAREVRGWRDEGDGTWSAEVPWVTKDRETAFRFLVVNGEMRPRARLPKKGKGYFTILNDDMPEGTRYNAPRHSFFYDPAEFKAEWKGLENAEITCFSFWDDNHVRIASVDSVSNKVSFVYPCGKAFDTGWSNNKTGGNRGFYIIENFPAAMTDPGEWRIDYVARRVHYRPRAGERLEDFAAEVPFVRELVSIRAEPVKDGRFAERIAFRGIRFTLAQFELKRWQNNNNQGASETSAAIFLAGARNCRFERCEFDRLSAYALELGKGTFGNAVSHCRFHDLGAGGVRIAGGGFGCHPFEMSSGNGLSDCEIVRYGREFRNGAGVMMKECEKTRIVHNHIFDGYYTGISMGWSWGYAQTNSRLNELLNNHIHRIGQGILSDMGGIYMLVGSYGTHVANNRIHDVDAYAYGGWGIYNDEGSQGLTIENNVVYDTKFSGYDIHYARDVVVRNNIFAFGRKDQISRTRREPHVSCVFTDNIVYWEEGELYAGDLSDAKTPFDVYLRPFEAPSKSTVTFIANRNCYFNPKLKIDEVKFGAVGFDAWRKIGRDVDSVYADPLFVDAAARDFHLKPGSPAHRLGFMDFDQSAVGPRPAEAKDR